MPHDRLPRRLLILALATALLLLAACGGRDDARPTRTPVPTWTPTPLGALPPAGEPAVAAAPADATPLPAAVGAPPTAVVVEAAPTPLPPPVEAPTLPPAEPPTVVPTPMPIATEIPTATPAPPTETPTPVPTATPSFLFELEEAAQFPTLALAANVVRIWLYAYSPAELGLEGYSLAVSHNGAPLTVDEVSTGGVPQQTRPDPGPFTRFTNMNVIFIEPQAGVWEVQLLDPTGAPAGPPARFELNADQAERELYVRYKQVRPG